MSRYPTEILDTLHEMVRTAWGEVKVHLGTPRIDQITYPYAVIRTVKISESEHLVVKNLQVYELTIHYINLWPTGEQIEKSKWVRASELADKLLASKDFGEGLGFLPMITEVEFIEEDEPDRPTYEVVITFKFSREEFSVKDVPGGGSW